MLLFKQVLVLPGHEGGRQRSPPDSLKQFWRCFLTKVETSLLETCFKSVHAWVLRLRKVDKGSAFDEGVIARLQNTSRVFRIRVPVGTDVHNQNLLRIQCRIRQDESKMRWHLQVGMVFVDKCIPRLEHDAVLCAEKPCETVVLLALLQNGFLLFTTPYRIKDIAQRNRS